MRNVETRMRDMQGQASVEAALLIPVLFLGLLLLIQPSLLLYDRMVMNAASSEACRLLATKTDSAGVSAEACEAFVRHRLGAIPDIDCFHVHKGGCTWDIELEGDETSEEVRVRISTEVKLLPLLGALSALMGATNENGNVEVQVEQKAKTQPDWVSSVEGGRNPGEWVGAWLS